jgi:hypothetical protein
MHSVASAETADNSIDPSVREKRGPQDDNDEALGLGMSSKNEF